MQALRFYLPEAEPGRVTTTGLTAPASRWGFFFCALASVWAATRIEAALVVRNDALDHLEGEIAQRRWQPTGC